MPKPRVLVSLFLAACANPAALVDIVDVAPGDACPAGGTIIQAGVDDDGDGELAAEEVDSSTTICNGTNGNHGSLVRVSAEPPGVNCATGGQRVETGVDTNGDGILDPSEVTDTTFVCDGADGLRSLVDVVALPFGDASCPRSGHRIDHGIDDDDDGVLDPSEIDDSTLLCKSGPIGSEIVGTGIHSGLLYNDMVGGSWRACYVDTYSGDLDASDIRAACEGEGAYAMMGCASASTLVFDAVAADTIETVIPSVDDGTGFTDHRAVNGVGWYFAENHSIGFFVAGDGVRRNEADTEVGAFPELRMSWHTIGTVGGYRCGETLVSDGSFYRMVFVRD